MSKQSAPAISLFMPTHRTSSPPHMQEDHTRYKNLIREIESQMKEQDIDHAFQKEATAFFEGLLDDQEFWRHQHEGLAMFFSKDVQEFFNLSVTVDEFCAVSDQFYVLPLLTQAEENQEYTVLALSVHEPKIYHGSMYSLEESTIELPTDPETAFQIDEMHINKIQPRGVRVRQPNTGTAPGIFHGHGGAPREVEDDQRKRFFKLLDSIIASKTDTSLPLVIIGVESYVVEYKQVSSHQKIVEQHIDGNAKNTDIAALHQSTWDVVYEHVVMKRHDESLNTFGELIASNRSTTDPKQVEEAAEQGRVDTLFTATLAHTTDTVADSLKAAPKIIFPDGNDAFKLNKNALNVFEQGGRVLAMTADTMPDQAATAATLRY